MSVRAKSPVLPANQTNAATWPHRDIPVVCVHFTGVRAVGLLELPVQRGASGSANLRTERHAGGGAVGTRRARRRDSSVQTRDMPVQREFGPLEPAGGPFNRRSSPR